MELTKYLSLFFGLLTAALLAACTQDDDEAPTVDTGVTLRVSLSPFDGEKVPRTSVDGLSFEEGDRFRMKIICPHTSDQQVGEIWGSGFYEFTMSGFNQDGVYIGSSSVEAQATTYVYTAQNSTGKRIFVVGNTRYSRSSNFFCADQSRLEQFKQSDVVWAQAIRQTGAREVHLRFSHKVAKLDITLRDDSLTRTEGESVVAHPLSGEALLTLEGMPDIDGAEIVVGDYYADECYENENFSYRQKASCSYENNGRVLGIEVLDEAHTRSSIARMTGNPTAPGGKYSQVYGEVANNATYTAYRVGPKHYLLYVPPCVLTQKAVFWVRDGERRYSAKLSTTQFEEGKCYPVEVKLKNPTNVTHD